MRVLVNFVGHVRLEVGCREIELQVAENATVAQAVGRLAELLGPDGARVLVNQANGGYNVLFTVNGRAAESTATLADGDTLGVVPPIAGGAPGGALDATDTTVKRGWGNEGGDPL